VKKDTGGKKKRDEARKQADEQRRRGRKRRGGRGQALLGVLHFAEFLPYIWRLVRGVLRNIKVRSLSVDLTVGLDDPADTALLVGTMWTPVLLMEKSGDTILIRPNPQRTCLRQAVTHSSVMCNRGGFDRALRNSPSVPYA